jgi:ribosome biogenesis protein NSA1
MRVITGDDCGMVKFIYNNQIKSIGSVEKSKAIHCMAQDQKNLLVCRENGQIDIIDIDSMKVTYTKTLFKERTKFIGCFLHAGVLVTCTDKGIIQYIHWSADTKELPEKSMDLNQVDLCRMRVHPSHPHIFATGGNERELCLWDIHKDEPIWKAKNVPNDHLDLRVKVWVTDIRFVDNDYNRIVIVSGHHHVRIYDTNVKRRPMQSFTIGEYPLKSVALYQNEILTSDTAGKVTAINQTTGKVCGSFKGIAGAVSQIECFQDQVFTVGLDRHLRVFEAKGNRKELKKVYLKHRILCLVIDEDYEEEQEPQDVWDSIPQVEEERPTKKQRQ